MANRGKPTPNSGSRPSTIIDVARLAGVNPSTVSRVLSGAVRVKPETEARVLNAANRLQYRPSRAARSLASRRSMTIGVLLPDLRNLMHADFLAGAQHVLVPHGYSLLICDGQVDATVQRDELERLFELRIDGLLVTRAFALPALVEPFRVAGIPVEPIEVLEPHAEESLFALRGGSMEAFRHVLDLGHRRLAFFIRARGDRPGRTPVMRARTQALLDALAERGLPAIAVTFVDVSDPAQCAAEVRRLNVGPDAPTVWVGGNDWMSAPLLGALTAAGLRVPDDASLLCYGDSLWAEAVRLSVVRYDYRREGALLARRLLARLGTPGIAFEEATLSPDEFVPRGSLGAPHPA